MREFKIKVYFTKKRVRKTVGEVMDKIFVAMVMIIAIPFILLGAFLAWLEGLTNKR